MFAKHGSGHRRSSIVVKDIASIISNIKQPFFLLSMKIILYVKRD